MLAIMLAVFAITAGLLAVFAKNKVDSPFINAVGDYSIDKAVRTNENISVARLETRDNGGNMDAWSNILYPNKMYFDISEDSLDNAGYYFDIQASYSSGSGRRINYFLNTFGLWRGKRYDKSVADVWKEEPNNNCYTFMRLFGYTLGYELGPNCWDEVRPYNSYSDDYGKIADAPVIAIGASDGARFDWRYNITGDFNALAKEKVTSYRYENDQTVSSHWLTYKKNLWTELETVSGSERAGFANKSEEFLTVGDVQYPYTTGMQIDIIFYDKSELKNAIDVFNTKLETDKNLEKIGALQNATKFIGEIERDYLKKREVTQDKIQEGIDKIDNYVFEVDMPELKPSKVYDGKNFNIEADAFSQYHPDYFDVQLLDKNGNPVTPETMVNVDDYKIKVTLKNEVNGDKFVWADGSGNETKESDYQITPRTFTAQVKDQTFKYKPSGYDVGINPAYENHVGENQIIVALSLKDGEFDGTTDKISVSDAYVYTVYYKITSTNHNDILGSFTLTIEKADIVLYTNKMIHTYGERVPTQDEILDNIFDWDNINIFDAVNNEQKRNYIIGGTGINGVLSSIAIAKDGSEVSTDTFADVGQYNLLIEKNSAFDNNVNISFAQDGDTTMDVGVYVVNPRSININWTMQAYMWYDGDDKKPVASIDENEDLYSQTVNITVTAKKVGNETFLAEAINAGDYIAQAATDNNNFVIADGLNTKDFKILKRVINVKVQDYSADYGERNAKEFWDFYIAAFEKNSNNEIYELTLDESVTDGKGALGGSDVGYEVFKITLKNGKYTDDSANKYYLADTYVLEPSILADGVAKNYVFGTATSGKCTVNNAEIDFTLQDLPSFVFKGVAQDIGLNKSDERITFKGWENDHRDNVKLYFANDEAGLASSTAEKFEVTNAGDYTIYYKITAPNHNDLISYFTLKVEKAAIYIDVSGQTSEFIYGNVVPTSDELVKLLGISFRWQSAEFEISDIDKRISFHLLDGSGSGHYQSGDKITVGSYTVYHAFVNNDKDNYTIEYVQNDEGNPKNNKAFKVSQKELRVDWTQNSEGWNFNQAKNKWEFTYNGNTPEISVKANAEDVVSGDVIKLSTEIDGKVIGTYNATTALTNDNNKTNYKLIDDTFEFDIVKREVKIIVNDISGTFGQVQQNSPIGSDKPLLAPGSEGAIWNYYNDSAKFISDDFSNFCFISDAIVGKGYQNVGKYDINIAAREGTSGEITNNYNVSIVGKPKFTISPANISYSGTRFNIDLEDEGAIKFITKDYIKGFISIGVDGISLDEFDIFMSDLKENANQSETWVDQISLEGKQKGNYYFSLKIAYKNSVYKNFNDYNFEVEVNISQGWISVTINGTIKVTYGDTLASSDELFDMLKDKIDIDGLSDMTPEQAFDYIKRTFKIYVGTSDGALQSNGPIGAYSIYFDFTGVSERNIRFLNDSNIKMYIIDPKKLEMDWDDFNANEVYGEHNDNSPSHECVTRLELANGDKYPNVKATAIYEMYVDGKWVAVNQHAINVGRYRVIITGVNSDNYFVEEGELVKEFEITPANIEISLNDRDSVVYGGQNSSRYGIIDYLNHIPDGIKPYEIISGGFYYGDEANLANIFSFTLNKVLADGKDYYDVDTYTIDIIPKSNNYKITVSQYGSVKVTNANIEYTRAQFVPRVYTGKGIKVEPVNGNIYYVLKGDIKEAKSVKYKINGSSDDFTSELFVTEVDTYEILIQIIADNHNEFITSEPVTFEVKAVHVEIKMSQATKEYGDTLDKILADENVGSFHEWLVKKCNITFEFYTLDDSGNRVPVTDNENLKKDFVFKVVQNEHGGEDPIVVGKNKVGTYTVTHEADGDFKNKMENYIVNYWAEDASKRCNYDAYKIEPKKVEVVWTGNEFTYNGKLQAPTASINDSDLIGDDTCVIDVKNKQVNKGPYTAIAALSNDNYSAKNATFNYVINPKGVDLVWSGNKFTYNGKSQAPTASVKAGDLFGDDRCVIDVKGGQINVGSYTATATLTNNNYTIASNATFGFVVNPKSIAFTWTDDVLTYNGSKQAPKAIASGVVDGDIVEFIIDGAAIKAGTGYVATVTGIKDNANYVVDSEAMKNTKVFSIQKAKNEFVQIDDLPDKLDKLPWINGGKPESKYGDVVVKYFSDKECTKEVTDIAKAGNGKYWIVVSVADTDDYEGISRTFEVEITGATNMVGIIAGSVAGGVALLAIIAVAVILVIKKKKKA